MGFQIGSFLIPYYGFFIVIGVLGAALIGVLQTRLFHKSYNDFILLVAFIGLGGFVGAKILYLLVTWQQIDFSRIFDLEYLNLLMSGGFVFYGGLLGGLLALLPCKKLFKQELSSYINIYIPCIPLAHAFGRLGCNAVGCCYGIPYDGVFSVLYENSLVAPNHIHLFPVQAVEACGNFIIALILLIYIDLHREHLKYGIWLYLLMYAPFRFVLEFFRYDTAERGMFGVFSISQWISILLVMAALIGYFYQRRKNKGHASLSN